MEQAEQTKIYAVVMNGKSAQSIIALFSSQRAAVKFWSEKCDTQTCEVHHYLPDPLDDEAFIFKGIVAWSDQ